MIQLKVAKKINLNGEKCYKLIGFSMLEKKFLPDAYIKASHHCYKRDDNFLLASARIKASEDYLSDSIICTIGDSFLEDDWKEIVRDIRICAKTLQKINRDCIRQVRSRPPY